VALVLLAGDLCQVQVQLAQCAAHGSDEKLHDVEYQAYGCVRVLDILLQGLELILLVHGPAPAADMGWFLDLAMEWLVQAKGLLHKHHYLHPYIHPHTGLLLLSLSLSCDQLQPACHLVCCHPEPLDRWITDACPCEARHELSIADCMPSC
jgi:hypothetical protein